MRSLIFAKRNIKEYLRSPLMLFFTIGFPILMFFIFQIIKLGTGATDEIVPMFSINNLVSSICIFSYSFITLSLATQIAKDRTTSLQSRLQISPMNAFDFFAGYFLPSFFIAIIQTFVCFLISLCFGLTISLNLILAFLCLIVISIFYISFGILIGSLFSEKSCAGISSIFVNISAIFSGMFFPLTDGTFKTILSFLPFLPSIAIPQAFINNNFSNIWLYSLTLMIYFIITFAVSILIFNKRIKVK